MLALRVVALLLCVSAARLPHFASFLSSSGVFSTSQPLSSHPILSLPSPPSSLAVSVKLLDACPPWALAWHPGHRLMRAHMAAGWRCPRSRESQAHARSPAWVICAPGSRSYTSPQAGVARAPRCEPPSRGLQGQRRAPWAPRTMTRCLVQKFGASTATSGLTLLCAPEETFKTGLASL